MTRKKHIIIIHGRSTKPQQSIKQTLVNNALINGIQRINKKMAKAIEIGDVKVTVVYYGDILNQILVENRPELKKELVWIPDNWYVPDNTYNKPLQKLIKRPLEKHTKEDYDRLIEKQEIIKFGDDLATIASPFLSLIGITQKVINKLLLDLGSYLTSRVVGSQIRERLQPILRESLLVNDDIALISHSMGCMVSYDVLWKFSRMSEYKDLWEKKISLWMTLGNPLGEPAVKKSLYDSNEPNDGMYPTNIMDWINIRAVDDFVAHDGDIKDDFHQMLERNLIRSITDEPEIYTFWVDEKGKCNPHKLYGYLNHPVVSEKILNWLQN